MQMWKYKYNWGGLRAEDLELLNHCWDIVGKQFRQGLITLAKNGKYLTVYKYKAWLRYRMDEMEKQQKEKAQLFISGLIHHDNFQQL